MTVPDFEHVVLLLNDVANAVLDVLDVGGTVDDMESRLDPILV